MGKYIVMLTLLIFIVFSVPVSEWKKIPEQAKADAVKIMLLDYKKSDPLCKEIFFSSFIDGSILFLIFECAEDREGI